MTPTPRLLAAAALTLLLAPLWSRGAEPTVTVGRVRITRLQDAEFPLPAKLLSGIEPAEAKRMLGGSEATPTPANAFLVRTEDHLVLVDTGTGPKDGKLVERLKAAGVAPSDVDLVLITHFHLDHVGGLLDAEGGRAFPKAVVRASKAESDFWLGDPSKVPERARGSIPGIQAALAPYQAVGAFRPFGPDEVLGKGIRASPAAGHTPGHTVYVFGPAGKELWCIGDLIHFGAVQFERPGVAVGFDVDPARAVPAREELFQRAASTHAVLAGVHLFELVQLERKGEGFAAKAVR